MYQLINPTTGEKVCRDVFKSFQSAKRVSLRLAAMGISHVIRLI